jgi:uncharacterized membrane protein YbhN (UPF0104 family)
MKSAARLERSPLRWAKLVVAAIVIALLGSLAWPSLAQLPQLWQHAPAELVLVLVLAHLAGRFFASEATRVVLGAQGTLLARREVIALGFSRELASLMVPRAGFGMMGLYLWRRHGVRPEALGGLALALVIGQMGLLGVLGLLAQGALWATASAHASLTVTLVFAVAAIGALVAARVELPAGRGWLSRLARRAHDGWRLAFRHPARRLTLLALLSSLLAVRALALGVALAAVGARVDVAGVAAASLLADLSMLASVTPQGLGIREAAVVYVLDCLQIAPPTALAGALLQRLAGVLVTVVGAAVALPWARAATSRVSPAGSDS